MADQSAGPPGSDLPNIPVEPSASRPLAIGMVRPDISGADIATHALEIQCYAASLGYRWLLTLRPPGVTADSVGYVLAIAAGMDVSAILVPDLDHIDNRAERITAGFDLVTVSPARLWRRGEVGPIAVQSLPLNDCTFEPTQLERDCARRLWEVHRDCFPDCLARLAASAALSALDEVD